MHQIKYARDPDRERWDGYVRKHPHASVYHLFGWRDVIHKTYGHQTYYLMVVRGEVNAVKEGAEELKSSSEIISGIVPLVHLKHRIFGNRLVSMPFLDSGGILADCREAEERILSEVICLGEKVGAAWIELRHEQALLSCDGTNAPCGQDSRRPVKIATRTDKVRMLFNLPRSSEMLLESFKSKLRSQVRRSLKEGFTSNVGGLELLDDFYDVFVVNMRDLGSPVHSLELMRQILTEFNEHSRILVIYRSDEPVAAGLVVGYGKVLRNPWAASLRKYASVGPNMHLYLRMLEYACDAGYKVFDFGRSSKDEGTYRFKEQWGTVPAPLTWYLISLDGNPVDVHRTGAERFRWLSQYWRKLPLEITKILGPRIRKHISL
jgi:FemAB-related protein (PEP-CTERM system-associated)